MTLSTEPQHLLKVYAGFNVALTLNNNITYVAWRHEVPHVSPSFYLGGKGLGLLSPDEKVLFGHLCVVAYNAVASIFTSPLP
jgi:hypothetical protein